MQCGAAYLTIAFADTYVVEKTSNRVGLLMDKLKDAGKRNQWTSGMDEAMGSLHEEGVSVEAIEECMRGITIDPAIKESMQQMAGQGADIRVLSDANTLFISWILEVNTSEKMKVIPFKTCPDSSTLLRHSRRPWIMQGRGS